MSSSASSAPAQAPSRLTGWLLAGVALPAMALLVWTLIGTPAAPIVTGSSPAATAPAARPPAAPIPQAVAPSGVPSFDIVRVGPTGETVIAGRARPGAQVMIADAGRAIAQAQADARGQWVALPAPLTEGGHQLTVASAGPGPAKPAAPVIVLVPATGHASPSGPLALLAPEAGMPRLLQAPQPAARDLASLPSSGRLGLGIVDYDTHGAIRFAGTAPAGSIVRVYVDRRPAGDAHADAQGRWMLQPAARVAIGQHQLRLDQLASSGAVSARVALPFDRVLLPEGAVLPGSVVVQPGQSLWRIARHVYGLGIRYTVIYLANRSQIRNPALIYPGQVFAVPDESASRPNPASSSTSR